MAARVQDLLTQHKDKLPLIDLLLNFLLLTPVVVLHYHATCQVLDYILVGTFPRFGPYFLFVTGISITFTFAYYQRKIPEYVSQYLPQEGENSEVFLAIASRAYTFALTFVTLSHMKAVTDLFLQSTGGSLGGSIKATVTSIIVLWGMRGSRNLLAPPVSLGLDTSDDGYNEFSTAFMVDPGESYESAADTLATIGIAYTMIHLHWAGLTSLMDNILFPNHFWLSVFASLVLGYAVCAAVIYYQYKARDMSRELERQGGLWHKLAFEDIYIFVASFGVINVWRGIWMFYDALTLTFPVFVIGTDVTCFLGLLVSFLTLLVGQLTNSLPYKGYDVDGAQKDGEGCLWNTNYLIDLINDLEAKEEAKNKLKDSSEDSYEKDDMNQNSKPSDIPPASDVCSTSETDASVSSSKDSHNGVTRRNVSRSSSTKST